VRGGAARLGGQGRVGVDTSGVQAARLSGDPAQLARLVHNLADNAERHAASAVGFALATRSDRLTLTVTDDGPGVPPADRERIFERFTRLDGARGRDTGGGGARAFVTAPGHPAPL